MDTTKIRVIVLLLVLTTLTGCASTSKEPVSAITDNKTVVLINENAVVDNEARTQSDLSESDEWCAYKVERKDVERAENTIHKPVLTLKEPWKLSELEQGMEIPGLLLDETVKEGIAKVYYLSYDRTTDTGWEITNKIIGIRGVDDSNQMFVAFFNAGSNEFSEGTSARGEEDYWTHVSIINEDSPMPFYEITSGYNSESAQWCSLSEMYIYDPETDDYIYDPQEAGCDEIKEFSEQTIFPGYIVSYNNLKPIVVTNDALYDCAFSAKDNKWTLTCVPKEIEHSNDDDYSEQKQVTLKPCQLDGSY